MARLPFNPDLVPGPPAKSPAPPGAKKTDNPWTVTQLASAVRDALTVGLPAKVRVIGQISNLSNRAHWFFSMKDSGAAMRCVCFQSNARKIRFDVKDGMEVIATGRIDFYDAQGNVQLYVDKMEPVGVGELELRYRALCDDLRKLGYFEIQHKKPLPPVPRCVAIVTSRKAAALQDVINTAEKRWRGCRLLLMDVRVQGDAAAGEIAAAIKALNKQQKQLGLDAIILTRGGGSIEDLWAFNERVVADAVFKSDLPIVAAIGHETDTTIAELVADLRCATPTQAAMTVIPDGAALNHQVDQLSHRMASQMSRMIDQHRRHLDSIARHEWFRRPDRVYEPIRQRLNHLAQSLANNLKQMLGDQTSRLRENEMRLTRDLPRDIDKQQQHINAVAHRLTRSTLSFMKQQNSTLDAVERELDAVSPKRVLQRGYSLTLTADGKLVRSKETVSDGEVIRTVLADGQVTSRVEVDQAGDGGETGVAKKLRAAQAPPTPPRSRSKRRSKRTANDDDGPTLF